MNDAREYAGYLSNAEPFASAAPPGHPSTAGTLSARTIAEQFQTYEPPSGRDVDEAKMIESSLDAIIRARDEAAMRAAKLEPEVWDRLTESAKEDIIRATLVAPGLAESHVTMGETRFDAEVVQETMQTAGSSNGLDESFQRIARGMISSDDFDIKGRLTVVLMCDPPIDVVINGKPQKVHPGVSRIPIRDANARYRDGYTFRPVYPFLPDPTLPCPITNEIVTGYGASRCTMKCRTQTELELHMETTHPMEYAAYRAAQDRKRSEEEREEARLIRETLLAMVRQYRNDRETAFVTPLATFMRARHDGEDPATVQGGGPEPAKASEASPAGEGQQEAEQETATLTPPGARGIARIERMLATSTPPPGSVLSRIIAQAQLEQDNKK